MNVQKNIQENEALLLEKFQVEELEQRFEMATVANTAIEPVQEDGYIPLITLSWWF